jgi:NhaP-type Na+/H+ or K+/H+ antiporter
VICVSMNQLAASLPFRYIHKNLSPEVRRLAGFIFHLLAYMSETSCFALLGLSVFLLSYPAQYWVFMLSVVALCMLARPLAVYPLLIMVSGQCFTVDCIIARCISAGVCTCSAKHVSRLRTHGASCDPRTWNSARYNHSPGRHAPVRRVEQEWWQ